MAHLEKRNETYRIVFTMNGQRFSRSLGTKSDATANLALAKVEDGLNRIKLGLLPIDPADDVIAVLLSSGSNRQQPTVQKSLNLGSLLDRYFESIPEGSLEQNTIGMLSTDISNLKRHLGTRLPANELGLFKIQSYVNDSYTYDNLGRALTVTLPDPDDAGPKSSPVQSYGYDAAGNLTSTTDALGRTTTYAYDDLYRMTSVTRPDPDGTGPLSSPVVSYQYNDQGLLASKTDPLSRATSYAYDSAGRLTSTTDPGNNTSSIAYDLLNRVTSQTSPDPDGSGPLTASVTTFNYDIYSRLTSTVDAAGKSTTNEYDIVGQRLSLTDASGNTTRWAYDDLGRMTMETDERGHTRTFNHNVVDRLVRMTDRNGRITRYANSGLDLKEYWYERTDDPHTTVATVTQGSTGVNEVQTVTISNLSEGSSGGGGLGGPAGGGDPVDFFRIAFDGQVTEPIASTADATDVEAALEDLATVDDVQVTHSGDVFTITFVGDHAGTNVSELMADVYFGSDGDLLHELTITQDALYRMVSVDDDYADYTYTLDNLGRLTNQSETITGLTPTIELDYDYDAVGNRISQSATIGTTLDFLTEFEYDDLNRLTNLSRDSQTGGNAVADQSVDFAYNALGQYSQIDRYEAITGTNPSLQSVYQYDTANRLSSLTHQHSPTSGSPTVLHGYTYSYDAMDRFVSIDSTVDGLSSFTFDKLSQLTDADHDSSRADEDYDYDDTGNRNNTGFTIGDDNLTTSDGSYNYEYDEEGNRTKRTEISSGNYEEYEWDHRNRLTKVSRFDVFGNSVDSVAYSYDIFNRMVRRTYDADGTGGNGPTDQFFAGFDGKHGTLEFDDDQATDVSHRYLWNGEVLIADEVVTSTSTAGDLQWALTDHVGTIRDIAAWDSTSSEFEVTNHRVYNSFGLLESETDSTIDLAFAFTSQWTDEITGLAHHLNRWFDPNLGKWLSDDPLSFSAGDVNLQRYVANRPLTMVDPTGLFGTNQSAANPIGGGEDQGSEGAAYFLTTNRASDPAKGGTRQFPATGRQQYRDAEHAVLQAMRKYTRPSSAGGELLYNLMAMGSSIGAPDSYMEDTLFPVIWNTRHLEAGDQGILLTKFVAADVVGLRQIDDFFWANDAADGHYQSDREQVTDLAVGTIKFGATIYGFSQIAKSGMNGLGRNLPNSPNCFVAGTLVWLPGQVLQELEIATTDHSSDARSQKYIWVGAIFAVGLVSELQNVHAKESRRRQRNRSRSASGDMLSYSENLMFDDALEHDKPSTPLEDKSCVKGLAFAPTNTSNSIKAEPMHTQPLSRMKRMAIWGSLGLATVLLLMLSLFSGSNSDQQTITSANPITANKVPIEQIRVGQRVLADDPNIDIPETTSVNPETWKLIRLKCETSWSDVAADTIEVETIQPPQWLQAHQVVVGAEVPFPIDLHDMGLPTDLLATVVSVETCPPIDDGPGRVVLSTIKHVNASLWDLTVTNEDGQTETLHTTAFHKFYSVDRNEWDSACDLSIGERIRGDKCDLRIVGSESVKGQRLVFNLSVEGEHVFFVGATGTLAHNTGCGKTETVQRWMSNAELDATKDTGLLRGGRSGTHYVTDSANRSAKRARQRLALGQTPEVRVTMDVPGGVFTKPSRVEPLNGMPGGGMERTASGDIPVVIKKVDGKQ